ncbi:uncharacterized protein LOC135806156 [Sycon ciliatum]|uniref:uncharacterized protein LOC135806156 n=1 Tax=Sycon ciliatum TaxID=27933 RepID=UPI0031F6FB9C
MSPFRQSAPSLKMYFSLVAVLVVLVATDQLVVCDATVADTADTAQCASARRHLDLVEVDIAQGQDQQQRDQYRVKIPSRICLDGGGEVASKCCSGTDAARLFTRAKQFVRESLKQQVSGLVRSTKILSRSLDDAVCHKLHNSHQHAFHLLTKVFGRGFRRNADVFNEFYCWLKQTYDDCTGCEQAVEREVLQYFKVFQLLIVKEHQNILSLNREFTDCTRKHADFTWFQELNVTFHHMLSSVKRAVCNTCIVKNGLKSARHLIHEIQQMEPPRQCVEQVACMQSCVCCSGGGGNASECTTMLPCRSCCHKVMSACTEHLTDVQTTMGDLSSKLKKWISFMQGSNSPDHHFERIGSLLADFTHYSSIGEQGLQDQIEEHCGSFLQAAKSTGASRNRPFTCLTCRSVRPAEPIHRSLRKIVIDFPRAITATEHMQHRSCIHHSAKRSEPCRECPTCHKEVRKFDGNNLGTVGVDMRRVLVQQLRPMIVFQNSNPELYAVRNNQRLARMPATDAGVAGIDAAPQSRDTLAYGCDDEDEDCNASSGSGSGNNEVSTDREVRTDRSEPPSTSLVVSDINTLKAVDSRKVAVAPAAHSATVSVFSIVSNGLLALSLSLACLSQKLD